MNFFLAQAADDANQAVNTAGDAINPGNQPAGSEDAMSQATGFVEATGNFLIAHLPSIITVIAVILVALIVASFVGSMIRRACDKVKIDATLGRFFAKCGRWTIMVIAAIFILGEFGIETASLAIVIGSAGLAIGLAFQGTLSNLACGVMLLIFRPFKVGDAVNVSGQLGKVYEIDLFSTIMDTFDNRRIIIPNSQVFGSVIENITYHDMRRVDVAVGVEYSADIDKTREVLEKAVNEVEGGLEDPATQVVLDGLGDSAVNWVVRVWANKDEFLDVKQRAIRLVKKSLDEAEIGIPFPQMDVHLDGSLTKD